MNTGQEKRFVTAFQRNAFVLNKSGAVVESYAVAAADSAHSVPPDPPRPKRLVFDRPFYIILKRTDTPNPYFVVRVANAELLVKPHP